ncbi:energy-coupling factor transporter transmembrane protein EcfT [Caldibacillus thermoamylovorans]|uniref:energy-coupling factor transporter transmembrane component T family protein n=1 Tax=Bacillaceae TaxID=186817 RepID=UPI001D05DED6|nr:MULTISPECIES: energy-coupling factor transporter transmembrane protein EcfT [Bacillaceae]MCB5935313.1 energy-coupling factor transporter transmembrane protein EcfT [Bacillus sp. DFI.2.34]MCB7070448.1 energy-coupling factor transporter transmembrane protein EcfT [Caldibacillus sp. 210928-DFI.2.22]MCB7073972.1 energy-coupling factor transporter transmembrane protein EcfT [Caldibacillus sp. 210928-DFI.2.18]MCB7076173.1 energy-coupling factor transporter transmembrane protein EcfT [Caldibacillus
MMEKMIFGRYIPVDSPLHKMDPRAKLLTIIIFIAVVFLADNALTYGLLGVFTLAAIWLSNIPIKFLFNGLKFLFWIILFTFFLHIFFTKEGDLLYKFGFIEIYQGGLRQGIFISLRFFFLLLVTSLLTLTTTPIEITDGIESLLKPLKKVGFPVHELSLMISIALRFIPTLMDETDKIMKAQMARGVDFSEGTIKQRAKAVVPLLIPLFINAFKRAEELATAMEARGYRGGEGRTKYRLLKWGMIDNIAILTLFILTILLLLLR